MISEKWLKLLSKHHEEWEDTFVNKVMPLEKKARESKTVADFLAYSKKAEIIDKKATDKLFKFHDKFVEKGLI